MSSRVAELRFGTDGIRGVANVDLTAEDLVALGRACARFFGSSMIVVGRDTRLSGPMLQNALMAGMASEGVEVVDLGVLPTPGVAWVAAAEGCPAAVVTASHNPSTDNGVKLFGARGPKMAEADERALEAQFHRMRDRDFSPRPSERKLGAITSSDGAARYAGGLTRVLGRKRLDGLTVVVDAANGAASVVGPEVLRRLGATVFAIAVEPDGSNINDGCGVTSPGALQRAVRLSGADAGVAFDGDADRLIAVSADGALVDGDQIVGICALDRHQRGALPGSAVVVTVMSNLGVRLALASAGVNVHECPVGDRHVARALECGGWLLGGEQTGHIIHRDVAGSGDGIVSAVELLDVMRRQKRTLTDLAAEIPLLPQVVKSIPAPDPPAVIADPALTGDLVSARQAIGSDGRVLVRASGTESVVRLMVESGDPERARRVAERVAACIRRAASAASDAALRAP
ncbi:MAG: phosphoglucosamine mutase [Acidimicrobiia bacterium]